MALSIQEQALVKKAAEQGLGVSAAATTAANLAIAAGNNVNPTITPQSLSATQPYTIPTPKPDTTNYNAMTAGGTAQVNAPVPTASSTSPKSELQTMLESLKTKDTSATDYASMFGTTPQQIAQEQATAQSNKISANSAVRSAQAKLTGIQAELQAITDSAKEQNLRLEGTASASGRSMDYLNRQEQEVNRQSAIAALPLQATALAAQAEIASAQGDAQFAQDTLVAAQDKLDKVFTLYEQDQQNKVDMYNKQVELIYKDLTEKEKAQVDANKTTIATNQSNLADARNFAQTLSATATGNGQANIGAQLAQIPEPDISSKTFAADLQAYKQKVGALQGKITITPKATTTVVSTLGGTGAYKNDLDAVIGTVLSTIPSKFGQQTFSTQISKARNDADKLNIVAAQVLQSQPAEFKNDFRNQAVGIAQLDKAIAEIDNGTKTGVLNAAAQYTYNVFGKDFDPNLAKINNYITSAIQPYRNSVTGAAWGTQEDNEYQQLFGSIKYSPAELRQRLVQTKELLKSKSSEGLNAFTNPLGSYENRFDTGALAPNESVTGVSKDKVSTFDSIVSQDSGGYLSNLWSALVGK